MPESYPLKDLHRVRKFREDTAAAEMSKRRLACEAAADELQRCKKALEEYQRYRISREQALYQEICGQAIQRKVLDQLQQSVQILREKDLQLKQEIQDAESRLEQARNELQVAREKHQQARKDREKIDEHWSVWAQQKAKESEANAEKETEDFRVRSLEG